MLIFWCYNYSMENGVTFKTIIGYNGLFVMLKRPKLFPWGDYYLDLKEIAEQTRLTRHEILQRLPAIWEKDNTVL